MWPGVWGVESERAKGLMGGPRPRSFSAERKRNTPATLAVRKRWPPFAEGSPQRSMKGPLNLHFVPRTLRKQRDTAEFVKQAGSHVAVPFVARLARRRDLVEVEPHDHFAGARQGL